VKALRKKPAAKSKNLKKKRSKLQNPASAEVQDFFLAVSPKIKCHLFSKIEMSPFGMTLPRLERGVAKPCRQG